MRVLVFDNYDSFTYNLVHMVEKITHDRVDVFRNDEISIEQVNDYDRIILSPGPGLPAEAGNLLAVIKTYAQSKSILGVCLGHQAIAEAFGGNLLNLPNVYHGVSIETRLVPGAEGSPLSTLFRGLPLHFNSGRYHSWIVSKNDFPPDLEITAYDEDGHIMALQHKNFDVQGVQFHPESVLTPLGERILRNWIEK